MVKAEFKKWADDFTKRFPDVGDWLKLHPDTVEIWFKDVFSTLFLDHCLEANKRLLAQGLEKFETQKIPAMVSKIAQGLEDEQKKSQRQKQIDIERAAERERKAQRKDYKSVIPGSLWEKVELMGVWVEGFNVEFGRAPDRYERNKWLDDNVD